ncbi:phosphotransferase [Melittangium boletus]|uniref:phosphotransferase n=1 Tax=Melittangium boletus TaxID=83453 RepID=UPI003DA58F6A
MSSTSPYELIPAAWRDAVAAALRETFGSEDGVVLAPLHGGYSGAPVLKLTVAGQPHVLRVIHAPSPLNSPPRHFACMRTAAEQGLAPAVLFADDRTGICITRYIDTRPHTPLLATDEGLARFGQLLRRLHTGPAFPVFLDALQMIQGGLGTLVGAKYPIPALVQAFLDRFETVQAALRPHLTLAPCHNDLNPNNLLFDGERLWLVDWETACMGDPFLDLTTAMLWFDFSPAREETLLRAYWGAEPTPWQRARLEVTRQVSRCFYALVFLLLSLQSGQRPPASLPPGDALPSWSEARRALGTGTVAAQGPDYRFHLSLILSRDALEAMERPAFTQALQLLGAT